MTAPLLCARCGNPLPVHVFPGAVPERQAVFTVRDGQRVCAEPCAPTVASPSRPLNLPADETGD